MRIYYCEECNKRVTEADIGDGVGVEADGMVFCEQCAGARGISREVRAAEQETRALRRVRPSGRKGKEKRAFPGGVPSWIYVLGAAGAVLAAVLLVAVFWSGEKPRQLPRRGHVAPRPIEPAPLRPEPPPPAAPAATKEPADGPAPRAAAPVGERVVFVSDFETDAIGWERGRRVEDGSLPDSQWAYESTFESNRFLARRVMLVKHLLRPKRNSIFETGRGLCVAFDYLVSGDAASPEMEVVLGIAAGGSGQNWRHNVEGVVKDRWSAVKLSVMEGFSYNPEKGRRMPAGARVKEIKIGVGPGDAKLDLRVDNVRVVDSGATAE